MKLGVNCLKDKSVIHFVFELKDFFTLKFIDAGGKWWPNQKSCHSASCWNEFYSKIQLFFTDIHIRRGIHNIDEWSKAYTVWRANPLLFLPMSWKIFIFLNESLMMLEANEDQNRKVVIQILAEMICLKYLIIFRWQTN